MTSIGRERRDAVDGSIIIGRTEGQTARRACLSGCWLQSNATQSVLVAFSLLAAVLRVVPWLAGYPLHRDEALYGYWARLIASGRDPLLLTAWVDKPPLAIYLLAASLKLGGVSELALRLPGMIAGLLLIPATYTFARQAYDSPTARLASALVALSPFAILFAPTAFTDPWLALWLLVASWAALADRPVLSGLSLGLAVASKQQGILAVPLVIGLLLVGRHIPGRSRTALARGGDWRTTLCSLGLGLIGFALVFGPLTYWDSLRWAKRPSFWDRSLITYGGLSIAGLGEWIPRAREWLEQFRYLYGTSLFSGIVICLAAAPCCMAAWQVWTSRRHPTAAGKGWPPASSLSSAETERDLGRKRSVDLTLGAYAAAYVCLHWLVTFQIWDRYLLPLVPLTAILGARGAVQVLQRTRLRARVPITAAAIAVMALAAQGAWLGATARLPVGSDHGAFVGMQQVASFVRGRPAGSVVFHHSLGWYFDFYLFDAPQERRWYDTPVRLASDAAATLNERPGSELWLALSDGEQPTAEQIKAALAAQGLHLAEAERIYRRDGSTSLLIYRITSTTLATHS